MIIYEVWIPFLLLKLFMNVPIFYSIFWCESTHNIQVNVYETFCDTFSFFFFYLKNYFSCVNGKTLLLSSGEFYYSSSEWFDYFFSIWGSYFGSVWIFSSLDVIDGIKSLKVLFFWTFYNKINWCYLLKKSL